jgi:hypothetical protein
VEVVFAGGTGGHGGSDGDDQGNGRDKQEGSTHWRVLSDFLAGVEAFSGSGVDDNPASHWRGSDADLMEVCLA